ncbi:DUF2782 domain-containing protein [Thiorhodovibrio frisius]|uniref:DUF2782 domain-containing protein n=1 Tax=Thiorhodovibrio frisius TaxID=631362 RepID=H8Z4L8_9GAMM|nr:DUF2782 domain-containing protein [Thiorhodovibrio frisius]EIC20275.1 Protein of unknown function (DUF2782) [Thiorhodovibrio frisius]WPL21012.1 hypothetical protein Thiofri_01119 [Thiorhodovibrio frisius]
MTANPKTPNIVTPLAIAIFALSAGPLSAVEVSGLDLTVTDADIQPSVTLKQFDNRAVEEYSVNNNVYMLKITPSAGAPYYLVDQDGSGDMTWNRGQPGGNLQVPQWTLFRW